MRPLVRPPRGLSRRARCARPRRSRRRSRSDSGSSRHSSSPREGHRPSWRISGRRRSQPTSATRYPRIVCHSCALRPLGMSAAEVLALLDAPPHSDMEIIADLTVLSAEPDPLTKWPAPGSSLHPDRAERCPVEARRLLARLRGRCARPDDPWAARRASAPTGRVLPRLPRASAAGARDRGDAPARRAGSTGGPARHDERRVARGDRAETQPLHIAARARSSSVSRWSPGADVNRSGTVSSRPP